MNIFIDCGAYNGDSLEWFLNYEPLTDFKADQIICFEPSPRLFKNIGDKIHRYPERNIVGYQEAVWTGDGEIHFELLPEGREMGNTAMKTKDKWGKGQNIKVKSIDFSEWIKRFKNDRVIIKMDIEGAEFPVLEKMHSDGTDAIPEIILCEFHHQKMNNKTEKDTENLIKKLRCKVGIMK